MHVLVAQDGRRVDEHIKRIFERAKLTVTISHTGEEVLEKASIGEFDIILLDAPLPDLDECDVCRDIRKMHVLTPILVLTSCQTVAQKIASLDAGADDCLVKPFSFDELLARIRALLRRGTDIQDNKIQIGDVELDSSKYVVHRNGEEILLTSKEYKLLNYLMRNPNRLCTKSMLEEHVWGHFHLRNSNVIEVTMSRLRKKMNQPGGDEFITTRRGIGYVIEDE